MSIPKELAFEPSEYERRVFTVQQAMAQRNLDAVLLFSPHSIYYLSGMDSENLFDFQCLIVPVSGDPHLVIFDFELARFENSSWVSHVETFGTFDDPVDVTAGVVQRLVGPGKSVGLELRSHQLSVQLFQRLADAFRHLEISDAFGIVENCRLIKSEAEINYMRQAAALTDTGVRAGYGAIREDIADYEIASEVARALYSGGSNTVCWGPVIAAGYRAGTAHSTFNGYRVQRGDVVFFEITGERSRYTAPLMRTASLGQPSDEVRRVEEAGSRAVETILKQARAGAKASEVAIAALRDLEPVLDSIVFHNFIGYPVGIGYPGTWIEELGFFIRRDNDRLLATGMVFHLPISLRKYGEFGVNLSHTILIRDDGAEALTHTPAQLHIID